MAVARSRGQSGFTLIELMIAVAIIGLLASIGLGQYREYTRRAKLSEVILASSVCKTFITENYLSMQSAPDPGTWGCEANSAPSVYVGGVKTSADGVIRVTIRDLEPALNGQFVYMVPVRNDGVTAMRTSTDLGQGVSGWLCGSDSNVVRTALPSSCRADTAAFASGTFE
jgi:type IV pilus assembly protein PilA